MLMLHCMWRASFLPCGIEAIHFRTHALNPVDHHDHLAQKLGRYCWPYWCCRLPHKKLSELEMAQSYAFLYKYQREL